MDQTGTTTKLPTSIPGISTVQTPDKVDPKTGTVTHGQIFFVGTECEHWAPSVNDCRFGCLVRAERKAAA
jgi:hypothetical protein